MVRVPGPPRGRRRRIGGGLIERIEAMRARELAAGSAAPLLVLSRDVLLLLKDLVGDPRVRRRDKVAAGFAVAYLASPVDLVPDFIPVLGQLDDLVVVGLAVRRLLRGAGYEVIHSLWRGSDEGLALTLTLAGVER